MKPRGGSGGSSLGGGIIGGKSLRFMEIPGQSKAESQNAS
jgi:hypothetical protein